MICSMKRLAGASISNLFNEHSKNDSENSNRFLLNITHGIQVFAFIKCFNFAALNNTVITK